MLVRGQYRINVSVLVAAGGKISMIAAKTQKKMKPHVCIKRNRGIHVFGSNLRDQIPDLSCEKMPGMNSNVLKLATPTSVIR